jgi:chemotaxis protein CheY-P-specific phosphatase CheC
VSKEQIRQIYDDYYASNVSVDEAASQLSTLLGDEVQTSDDKLVALLDAMQPQTTIPCGVGLTVATSCSRWCG